MTTSSAIRPGAYEMRGTYGHIQYHRGEDPDRRIYGVPVKVMWTDQVQYRCSFVLEVGREVRPGAWIASLRGGVFELIADAEGALRGDATFPDGTAGTVFIGPELAFGKRPVLVAARSQPANDGSYQSKTFAGDVAIRGIQAEVLSARLDPEDPDLTAPSPAAPASSATILGPGANAA